MIIVSFCPYSILEKRDKVINKQSLWFLTLFSLILVLSVYYITMPNELLLTNNNVYQNKEKKKEQSVEKEVENNAQVTIRESETLTAMRVSLEEERLTMREELQKTLTDQETGSEEKNNAYEQLRYLTQLQGTEEKLESKIKKTYALDSFVKVENNQVKVVISSKEHNNSLANNIMRTVQEEFTEKMYITVRFEK